MRVELVTEPGDERLAAFRLHERGLTNRAQRQDPGLGGRFVAEGDLVVERALHAGCRPVAVLCRADRPPAVLGALPAGVPVYGAAEDVRRHATGLGVALDVVGLFERPPTRTVEEVLGAARRVVVIEAVDNPTNLGAVLRSAAGLGWEGVLLDRTSADPLSRRALRTAMGATFRLHWARSSDLVADLAALGATGALTVALTPDADATDLRTLTPPRGPVALVLGSERAGISPELRQACSLAAAIPMAAGVDSLNVAAAAAIALHHLAPTGHDAG